MACKQQSYSLTAQQGIVQGPAGKALSKARQARPRPKPSGRGLVQGPESKDSSKAQWARLHPRPCGRGLIQGLADKASSRAQKVRPCPRPCKQGLIQVPAGEASTKARQARPRPRPGEQCLIQTSRVCPRPTVAIECIWNPGQAQEHNEESIANMVATQVAALTHQSQLTQLTTANTSQRHDMQLAQLVANHKVHHTTMHQLIDGLNAVAFNISNAGCGTG
jgi:hypothetical protein